MDTVCFVLLFLRGLIGAAQLVKSRLLIKTPLNYHSLPEKVHTFLYDLWPWTVLFLKDTRMFCKGKGQNKAHSCNKYCGNTRKYTYHIHSTLWNRFYREEGITRTDTLLSRSASVTDRTNKALFLNMHGTRWSQHVLRQVPRGSFSGENMLLSVIFTALMQRM